MHELLHAYIDGELDLAHTLEVERHLQECPACARACAELRELRALLRTNLPRFPPSGTLRDRVLAALPREDHGRRPAPKRWPLAALAAAAVLALCVAALAFFQRGEPAHERLVQEVIDSHVRSQMAGHLLDIKSSDQHRIKPWFQGKLDYSPTVRNLKDDDFFLKGGRLDYVNGRPVAALVYQRRRHVINVLTWPLPAGQKDAQPRSETRQGYHLVYWQRRGMCWWVISDLNPVELAEFAELLRGRE
jgi:anti-sigma factor RsiW